jgi:hypothetical protein
MASSPDDRVRRDGVVLAGLKKSYGPAQKGSGSRRHDRPWRDGGAPRAQRCGEDHDDRHDARPVPPRRRHRDALRASAGRGRGGGARRGHAANGIPPRVPPVRELAEMVASLYPRPLGSTRCSRRPAPRRSPPSARRTSPVGRPNGCASPWRSWPIPTSWCSTSRPRPWMSRHAATSGRPCARSPGAGRPSSSPRTTWRRRTRTPIGSCSSRAAGSSPTGRAAGRSGRRSLGQTWTRSVRSPASPTPTAAGRQSSAKQLFLSEGTVRNYLSQAIAKVGCRNRVEAALKAERYGWL